MLDDIIEAVIDIAADILEIVIRSRRKKKPAESQNRTKDQEPWERRDQAAPWEK